MTSQSLTDQDVFDAGYAAEVLRVYQSYYTDPQFWPSGDAHTIENAIAGFVDPYSEEPMADLVARYERGKALLLTHAFVASERSVVAGDRIYEQVEERGAVAIVRVFAGHIGTSQAYRYIGLVPRQKTDLTE